VWDFDIGHVRCVEIHHHERRGREAGRLVNEEVGALLVGVVSDNDTRRD
jgi:hypothetical protein